MLFLLVSLFLTLGRSNLLGGGEHLIEEMDELFTKLNSNATENAIINITNNAIEILTNMNQIVDVKRANSILNNVSDIMTRINSQDITDIISNLKTFTEDSKVYVNVDDTKLNSLLIASLILVILLIIITIFLFTLCLLKFISRQQNNLLYERLNDEVNNINNNIEN